MILQKDIHGPIAVIGDVHGHAEKLQHVLKELSSLSDYQSRWIVFIGDLVDRGPDSRGVIDCALALLKSHPKTTITCGNHELAMAGALNLFDNDEQHQWSDRWLDHYGSAPTFESYGVEPGDLLDLLEVIPRSHLELLKSVPWCVEHPDYFFVHSGLNPKLPFAEQRMILRTRDEANRRPEWLCSKTLPFHSPPQDCSKIVVSGHAFIPQVTFARKRILIDTTGGNTGSLSCVLLPENEVIHSDEVLSKPPRFAPEADIADLML